jgi:hypothetical protein
MSKNKRDTKAKVSNKSPNEDVKYKPSNFRVSQKEHKKINSYFLIIFVVGIIIVFLFYESSTILNQSPEKKREQLFNKFYSKELGLVVEDKLNVSALIEARIDDALILKEKLKTDEDFCILILDSEDHIIYDEMGEPLYVCTTNI